MCLPNNSAKGAGIGHTVATRSEQANNTAIDRLAEDIAAMSSIRSAARREQRPAVVDVLHAEADAARRTGRP